MLKTKKQNKNHVLGVEMHKVNSGSSIFEVLKQEERFGLHFWSLNDKEKGMTNAFSSKKLTSKLCLVYLEIKLQQNKCAFSN